MNLKSNNVFIAIIILISMMLICHTAHFFYDKNNFANTALPTKYNQINYGSKNPYAKCNNSPPDQATIDYLLSQAEMPCVAIPPPHYSSSSSSSSSSLPTPTPSHTKFSLDSLSDSEIAVIYKIAYENAGMEVLRRALKS